MKVKFINKYVTLIDINVNTPVAVYIDEIPKESKEPVRIMMLEEPLRSHITEWVINNPDEYDYVLTYEDDILKSNPKAILFRCADTWMYGWSSPERKFCVSTVVGGKDDQRMSGYAMRHELWRRKDEIKIPKEFFLSSHYKWHIDDYAYSLVLRDTKAPLFTSMFHIAIENRSMKHYYSEKLLDCFQTRTIPIYCGCENIERYFNIDGIIRVRSVNEIVKACNSLTPEVYEKMQPAAEDNFRLAQRHISYLDQLQAKIEEICMKDGFLTK